MKKTLFSLLIICSILMLTGCQEKIDPEEELLDITTAIKNISYYKSTITLRYSDEENTIEASFISQVNEENDTQAFKGKIDLNDELFDTLGYYDNNNLVIRDVNNEIVRVKSKTIKLKDLEISNLEQITNRAGEENLDYYKVLLNNKYNAIIGVGKADNIIYTIVIDLKANGLSDDKVVGIYELEFLIEDTEEEMPLLIDNNIVRDTDNFFDIFNVKETTKNDSGGDTDATIE